MPILCRFKVSLQRKQYLPVYFGSRSQGEKRRNHTPAALTGCGGFLLPVGFATAITIIFLIDLHFEGS